MTEKQLPWETCNLVNTTYTCGQCADDGHAMTIGFYTVSCPVMGSLSLRGHECAYSVERLLLKVQLINRLIAARQGRAELPLGGEIVEGTEDQL